jgi:transposase-like protein
MREIRLKHYDCYFQYVEQAVAEESAHQPVEQCPYCGSAAVLPTGTRCEACYLVVKRVGCPSCGCEFIGELDSTGSKTNTCPNCGGVCP